MKLAYDYRLLAADTNLSHAYGVISQRGLGAYGMACIATNQKSEMKRKVGEPGFFDRGDIEFARMLLPVSHKSRKNHNKLPIVAPPPILFGYTPIPHRRSLSESLDFGLTRSFYRGCR